MKKVIFALAAVVALAACSQEDVIVADKGAAIGFDTFVGKATRVDDKTLTTGNLKNFAVYGAVTNTVDETDATALIFNNVEVVKNGVGMDADDYAGQAKTEWKYAGTQYWIAGATYDFAAVAPCSCGQEGAFNATTKTTTIKNFTNDAVTDLLYAETLGVEGADKGNDPVGFDFRHVLSKVKFSFVNKYLSTGSTIRVRDIVLTNAHETATATLNANTAWKNHAGKLSIEFGNAVSDTATAATAEEAIAQNNELESYNVRFIIPGAEHTYTVSFLVDVLYGTTVVETYEHTASLKFTPAAGTAYDIKTVIDHTNIDPAQAQEPIEFTVNTMADWGSYTEKEAEII